jgi:hypothetical protein
LERACGSAFRWAGRRDGADNDADRQADQRRVSDRGLNPTRQHHDAGTNTDARAAIGNGWHQCAGVVTAATGGRQRSRRSQKAAGGETSAQPCAGSDCARDTCVDARGTGDGARGIERLRL